MKKKWLSLLLAGLMLLSLTACQLSNNQVEDLIQTAVDVGLDLLEEEDPADSVQTAPTEDDKTPPAPEPPKEELPPAKEPAPTPAEPPKAPESPEQPTLPEDGSYTSKEDVALYIHLYGHLPDNFITKKEARKLGWESGSLEPYASGMCIGGDYFGNYEGLLPTDREYTECDIDTLGAKNRGAKRIVFSDDGLIYYTGDHYKSFELLYGEE